MGDYHDRYLKSDVLILADVFENFRKTGKEHYNLDPAHYSSCPGFAWDAVLKMTDINLELITDIDMYQMVETGLRGGVSYIAKRYSKSNNKYLSDYLFAINRIKEELVLNNPIYVGMAILDLSKLLIYDFHYNYMLKKYDKKY